MISTDYVESFQFEETPQRIKDESWPHRISELVTPEFEYSHKNGYGLATG